MELSEGEKVIQKRAIEWARKVKNDIGKKLTDRSVYQVEDSPVSVFMAGSPGAGKTEAAKSLLAVHDSIIRLDIDDMRQYFDDYQFRRKASPNAGGDIRRERVERSG
ncbi:zeta toxin family protein [Endozoicomonas sp. ALC020]|uniref:zeta toxin family protein n=1 Tax=unclassified Endozoicomonas TaxID=2644528 RepID=UPI003BAF62C4